MDQTCSTKSETCYLFRFRHPYLAAMGSRPNRSEHAGEALWLVALLLEEQRAIGCNILICGDHWPFGVNLPCDGDGFFATDSG